MNAHGWPPRELNSYPPREPAESLHVLFRLVFLMLTAGFAAVGGIFVNALAGAHTRAGTAWGWYLALDSTLTACACLMAASRPRRHTGVVGAAWGAGTLFGVGLLTLPSIGIFVLPIAAAILMLALQHSVKTTHGLTMAVLPAAMAVAVLIAGVLTVGP